MNKLIVFSFLLLLAGCKETGNKQKEDLPPQTIGGKEIVPVYATGFSAKKVNNHLTELTVTHPWINSSQSFVYALIDSTQTKSDLKKNYDAVVQVPVKNIVVTSTTHIPALEALGVESKLIGFPDSRYISSPKTSKLVKDGMVKEIGVNESINTEVLINLNPNVVIGFSINNQNKTYDNIQKAGIPVIYNGDWVEESPLGKAEWIKFFGYFFDREAEANRIFEEIEYEYNQALELAKNAAVVPEILSGAMYKDVWYLPAGESWAAKFLKDANANYLWGDSEGTGSLSLSFESVLSKARTAEYWIGASQFSSYSELINTNDHYKEFDAFRNKKIYTFSRVRGEGGGVLYYELAPNRPDLVLKDLIKVLHPELLPDYETTFLKPLTD